MYYSAIKAETYKVNLLGGPIDDQVGIQPKAFVT